MDREVSDYEQKLQWQLRKAIVMPIAQAKVDAFAEKARLELDRETKVFIQKRKEETIALCRQTSDEMSRNASQLSSNFSSFHEECSPGLRPSVHDAPILAKAKSMRPELTVPTRVSEKVLSKRISGVFGSNFKHSARDINEIQEEQSQDLALTDSEGNSSDSVSNECPKKEPPVNRKLKINVSNVETVGNYHKKHVAKTSSKDGNLHIVQNQNSIDKKHSSDVNVLLKKSSQESSLLRRSRKGPSQVNMHSGLKNSKLQSSFFKQSSKGTRKRSNENEHSSDYETSEEEFVNDLPNETDSIQSPVRTRRKSFVDAAK